MVADIAYILFAILGLGFLIFLHELGHYWMARRVGMRVEVFAIGFGKPIYTWHRHGVKWQIGWLPFGGYVKIAGTESEEGVDPYQIPDGFFGKKPWDRIKVAFMGPFVNLLLALLLFGLLWASGGREKNYSEFSSKAGWVDPSSKLYTLGFRPGDEITGYDDTPFQGYKDHFFAPLLSDGSIKMTGFKIDPYSGQRTPFEHIIEPYPNPNALDKNIVTTGILDTGGYLIYNRLSNGEENPLPVGSPLKDSGIQYGDRILWIDGELIFSDTQQRQLLNDKRILLTVKRGEKTFLRRVPKVLVEELRPDAEFREELIDWQHEANIQNTRFQDLYVIPYNLSHNCVVEGLLRFIDKSDQDKAFPEHLYSHMDKPLQPGDTVLAIQGVPVSASYQILDHMQTKQVNIIVQREAAAIEPLPWNVADENYYQDVDWDELTTIAESIGTEKPVIAISNLRLLNPVTPVIRTEFPMSEEARAYLASEREKRLREIEEIEDPEAKAHFLHLINVSDNQLILGLPNPQDRKVSYNPQPQHLFSNVFSEIWLTLQALFSGALSPKYIAGPVGIIHVVQSSSMQSMKEALFWLGAISLNLGFLNLLPVPVLDGGTVVLSFLEMVTGKRLKPKTLEKVVVVFAILLISFFVFLTYNDILRIFGGFMKFK